MSERILKALMQLFSIVANVGDNESHNRDFVEKFLDEQFNRDLVNEYLKIYDDFYDEQRGRREGLEARKRTSLNSVKVLRICSAINKELTQVQKIYVLLQLLEFVYKNNNNTKQAIEFVETVSDTFNIDRSEYGMITNFVNALVDDVPVVDKVLIISDSQEGKGNFHHHKAPGLKGKFRVLHVSSVNMFFIKYFGKEDLQINGQLIYPEKGYVLTQGSSIRSTKISPIYYSDIISFFLSDSDVEKIHFKADNIEYQFKNGNIGLHSLSIAEESGDLIGIMGASGSGKSTLLNVLNGNYRPTAGTVKINGYDIHEEEEKKIIEGVIGYVSQDDLLIEELTVFQNLFFNAKLCFGDLEDERITELVHETLTRLGLYEIKHLKVGSPLNKTISGGQRKRLNIALELIREPAVLFVDEPTSGLSSRDSENIMDLLKELSLRGKLIFVVIHQPSSEIFKMFDKLVILDTGGFLIYNGNPIEAVLYFKEQTGLANSVESECPSCGNVNPEQIFNIIESKILDEYGRQTRERKIKPKNWYRRFNEFLEANSLEKKEENTADEPPANSTKIPSKWEQLKIFIKRDVLAKLTNRQYLLINFLEAPLLAFILSYIIKFSNTDSFNEAAYVFRDNENLTAYIFMSVIVALFLGMTVSAEEIIRDRKILNREKFLNLSRGSYLFSKVTIMFAISAIQMLTFVLIGNTILEIKGMYFEYWIVLFSTACFANILGLNISASFDSAVTIYILIPFLLIPQLILSGVIVKFDYLNPAITTQNKVPIVGEVMASKWAFEALAVNQFKNNHFNKELFHYDQDIENAGYKKNFWLSRLKNHYNTLKLDISNNNFEKDNNSLTLLYNEIKKENDQNNEVQFEQIEALESGDLNDKILDDLNVYFNDLNYYYIELYKKYQTQKDKLLIKLNDSREKKEQFVALQNKYTNKSLETLVTNKNELEKIIEFKGEIYQKSNPIYMEPKGFRTHFLSSSKIIFGSKVTTFSVNVMVLWGFTLFFIITLYMDVFSYFMRFFSLIIAKIKN